MPWALDRGGDAVGHPCPSPTTQVRAKPLRETASTAEVLPGATQQKLQRAAHPFVATPAGAAQKPGTVAKGCPSLSRKQNNVATKGQLVQSGHKGPSVPPRRDRPPFVATQGHWEVGMAPASGGKPLEVCPRHQPLQDHP